MTRSGTQVLIAILILIAALSSCQDNRERTVVLKVPTQMRGLITVRVSDSGCIKPKCDGELATYIVPADGQLTVSGDSPFFGWHRLLVQREDGTLLRVGDTQLSPESRFDAWQSGTVTTRDGAYFYVFLGTREEWVAEAAALDDRLKGP